MPIKSSLRTVIFGATACLFADCSSGGIRSSFVPSAPMHGDAAAWEANPRPPGRSERPRSYSNSSAGYVYVSNRTKLGSSELLVYPEGVSDPAPVRKITENLVEAEGIAVDSSGNVYVANGSGGNVLEFAPGGTSLVQTYSQGIFRPVNVTVADGILYVADQTGQFMEYKTGDGRPLIGIAGLGANTGIAVNPLGSKGTFFGSDTSLTAIPPTDGCPGSYFVGEDLLPTLWVDIPLVGNRQVSGLAFDPNGHLYASDTCANDVVIYSEVNYTWTYSGKVSGTFNTPLFLTINNQFLAIPSAASIGSRSSGYVTVIDLTKNLPTVTITNGLQYPIGAAVAFSSQHN